MAQTSTPSKRLSGRKLRKAARDLVHTTTKVLDYRKDLLATEDKDDLTQLRDRLNEARKARPLDEGVLEGIMEEVDAALRRHGGVYYPRSGLAENVETFLVAAILVLGFRTFFLQPFIIPTNSMYPTFSGMQYHVYEPREQAPNLLMQAGRRVFTGAMHYKLEAPTSGEWLIALQRGRNPDTGQTVWGLDVEGVQGRNSEHWFGLLPGQFLQYRFLIGDQLVDYRVPADFRLEGVIEETLWAHQGQEAASAGARDVNRSIRGMRLPDEGLSIVNIPDHGLFLRTGVRLQEGSPVLRFDILLGDMLMVDRMSYHFVRPAVGDPIVFWTGNVPEILARDGNTDRYYIKRLIGKGGDTISIEGSALLRNGEPIQGAAAFRKNAQREGEYPGYVPYAENPRLPQPFELLPGHPVEVPEGHYYPLGDNSPGSSDGRYWGFLPEEEVIGRAIFIYYPFTNRWGPRR